MVTLWVGGMGTWVWWRRTTGRSEMMKKYEVIKISKESELLRRNELQI